MTRSIALRYLLSRAALAVFLSAGFVNSASAQAAANSAEPSAAEEFVSAEVKKVGMPPGKLVLKHGAIPNLDMPAMTMTFSVANAQWLSTLEPGDKVRFKADKVNGIFTVTELTKSPG